MTRYLVWDSETTLATDTDPIPDLVCGVFYEPGVSAPFLLRDSEAADFLERRIDDPDTVFVTHNGPFDWTVLWKFRPHLKKAIFALYDADRIRDTQTRQQLLDVRDGFASDSDEGDGDDGGRVIMRQKGGQWYKSGLSLADLQYHHLGVDRRAEKKDPNSPRLRFHEVRGRPVSEYPREFLDYALGDGTGTWDVFQAQGPDLLPNEPDQLRSALSLKLIELRGMGVHEERTLALKARAEAAFAEVQRKMGEAGFFRVGERDPATGRKWKEGSKNKKVIEAAVIAAYAKQGLAPPKTKPTKTKPAGGLSCDKDSLKNSGDPLLAELSGSGPLGSIVNTYLPLLEAGMKSRLRTRFNNVLATGRISSSKPNLNNIPRKGGVRECIVPTPGFVLASADYDCAELRSHAQVNLELFGKAAMAEFFQRNPRGDPHLELAASILKITPEEAYARKAVEETEVMGVRQMCKALNFGLPGGMGPPRLQESARRGYNVVMSLQEAKLRRIQWLRRWPEMKRYFDYMSALTERQNHITQLFSGRRRGRSERTWDRWYSQCCNTLFQGLTADGAKHALWLVIKACYLDETSPLYGSHVVAFLYDELILEVPEARGHVAAMELERLMVVGMNEKATKNVPTTAGPKLMDRWAKGATAVYRDGILVPWTPPLLAAA